MEQRNINVLRLAVAACFGVAAGQAGAAATIGTSVGTVWALELQNSTNTLLNTGAGGVLTMTLNSIPGLMPTVASPMYLKVNLLNGAKWGGTPSLTCDGRGNAQSNTAIVTGSIDLGGTTNDSSVTFRVNTAVGGDTAGSTSVVLSATCTVSAASITVSGLTTKTVSAQIEYTNGAVTTTTAQVGNYITFQRGLSVVVSAPATGVVVDATSGSDNFVAGSNLTVGTAYIGKVVYDTNAAVTAFNSAGVQVSASDAFSTAVLTVSGPALAASIARGVTGVYLSTLNTCANAGVTAAYTTSPSATSVTFAGLTPANLTAGVFICATVPGNTTITTGQLTATLAATPLQTATLDTSATSNNIANLTANGSTRNAYFVNASTSTSKTSVVRLINRGGVAGAITATAYDEAGTVVGTANASIGTLGVNQMLSKTSAELETAIGYTPASATAKYSIVFSGAVASFEVLNFSKDVAGGSITLSNTSTTDTK